MIKNRTVTINDISELREEYIKQQEKSIKERLGPAIKMIEGTGFSIAVKEGLIKLTQKVLSLDFLKMPIEEAKKEVVVVHQLILKIIQDSLPEIIENPDLYHEFDQTTIRCFRENIIRYVNKSTIKKAEEEAVKSYN